MRAGMEGEPRAGARGEFDERAALDQFEDDQLGVDRGADRDGLAGAIAQVISSSRAALTMSKRCRSDSPSTISLMPAS
jgi:hypothetical protein